jgi:hypothetical protein
MNNLKYIEELSHAKVRKLTIGMIFVHTHTRVEHTVLSFTEFGLSQVG